MGKKMNMRLIFCLILWTGPFTSTALPQSADSNIHPLIQKSLDAVGYFNVNGHVLHYQAAKQTLWDYQSDRPYPPFISFSDTKEIWYDFESNTEKTIVESIYPTTGPTPEQNFIGSSEVSLQMRKDSSFVQVPDGTGSDPYLNPFSVLVSWASAENIRQEESQVYREYPRNILSREVNGRTEYLFLDAKTNFPVKVEFEEAHYLWGQVTIEYLYTTWWAAEQVDFPLASYKIVDGRTVVSRIHGTRNLITREESPGLNLPEEYRPLSDQTPFFLRQSRPDTIKVTDNTYLLKNPAYTEAVALIGDTVYLFDATQGEQRAKYDHAWIKKLFPGDHPIAVVVTDLAWPHIAGVRYWVSQGATVLSHINSRYFLTEIVNRKWRLHPDELEERREGSPFKFSPVSGKASMNNGRLQLYSIDGIGSEGALMAFLKETRFLWAGDFIQMTNSPSKYANDVYEAVKRNRLDPAQVGAQHIPLTDWGTINAIFNQ